MRKYLRGNDESAVVRGDLGLVANASRSLERSRCYPSCPQSTENRKCRVRGTCEARCSRQCRSASDVSRSPQPYGDNDQQRFTACPFSRRWNLSRQQSRRRRLRGYREHQLGEVCSGTAASHILRESRAVAASIRVERIATSRAVQP